MATPTELRVNISFYIEKVSNSRSKSTVLGNFLARVSLFLLHVDLCSSMKTKTKEVAKLLTSHMPTPTRKNSNSLSSVLTTGKASPNLSLIRCQMMLSLKFGSQREAVKHS